MEGSPGMVPSGNVCRSVCPQKVVKEWTWLEVDMEVSVKSCMVIYSEMENEQPDPISGCLGLEVFGDPSV